MLDGEASVMMMAMISSNSPSRQGARTEFLVPKIGFSVAAELWSVSGKASILLGFLGQGDKVVERGTRGGDRGGHTTPRRGPASAARAHGVGPLWPASVSSSGSRSVSV